MPPPPGLPPEAVTVGVSLRAGCVQVTNAEGQVFFAEARPPELAQDASPASYLQAALNKLRNHWKKRFDEAAPALAKYFATKVARRSDSAPS